MSWKVVFRYFISPMPDHSCKVSFTRRCATQLQSQGRSLLRHTGSRAATWDTQSSRRWTTELESDLFPAHHISRPIGCNQHPINLRTPAPNHSGVHFFLCHIAVAIDWNATDHFHASLICTYRLLANLSAMLGAEADGWQHCLRRAQQGRISQFPTEAAHIKSN